MRSYPVLSPVRHNGRRHEIGSTLELPDSEAKRLSAFGAIGESLPEPVEEGEEASGDETGVSIPPLPEEETPEGDLSPPLLVNLNTATNAELQALPFIGKGLAARIEKARPIQSLDSMPDLLGLGTEQWGELASLVTI